MQLTDHVLIADDERHVRHYISLIVRTLGPETIYHATCGEEAIALFNSLSTKPRLVILDINMPGIGGIETLRRLRNEGATCAIVMITSLATRETVEDAIAAGATAYIRKDTPKAEITTLLKEAWSTHIGEADNSEPADVISAPPPSHRSEESACPRRDPGPAWDQAWISRGM